MCGKYQLFRCDRFDESKKTGGGVLIAVSTKYPAEQIILSFKNDIEFVAVKIRFKNISLFISCSYIPPSSESEVYTKHAAAINSCFHNAKSSDVLAVFGDFNLPSISWNKCSDSNKMVPVLKGCVNEFIESLFDSGLSQINNLFNSCGKLLDLIFVNQPSDISLQSSHPVTYPEDHYHPTVQLKILLPSTVPKSNINSKTFCFNKTDYQKLNALLSSIQWNDILSSNNFNDMVTCFYNTLNACMSQSIPLIFNRTDIGPPWNNTSLAKSKNKKNKMFKKYKKTGSSVAFCNYLIARSEYNIVNKNSYKNYLIRMKSQLKSNPKSFYKFVNSKRRSCGFPNSLKFGSYVADDDTSICNIFADFFASTYSIKTYDESIPYPVVISESSPVNVPFFNISTVLANLKLLKNSFNPGPDGIPSNILKHCADSLSYPLTIIFNESLRKGYIPALWKESYIMPLFKSGSKLDVTNYRGIAKLSAIPKLLEKMITDTLKHEVSSLLSPCQHGFRKSRSTITNILELTTIVNEGIRNRKQTDVIYTDFSKAFDKVNHKLLLIKLNYMGFSNSLLLWLSCYLERRIQRVKFRDAVSRDIEVFSGVPQGSHLGPVLFTLFINDLPSVIQHSNILMYADDVKIFRYIMHDDDEVVLQSDLDSFSHWCNINLMELNIKKCKHMSFYRLNQFHSTYSLNGVELESVKSFLDLGILLDQSLTFRPHISMSVNKAYGVLGFMKRWSKEFTDPNVTKQLYISLVRPILEYGSVIWDPCYLIYINFLESVQKQFLLFCLRGLGWNFESLPSYESRLERIKLPSLKSRRTMLNVSFLLSIIRGDIHSQFLLSKIYLNTPSRCTRSGFKLLHINYYRSNYMNNDPFRRLCVQFNNLYHLIDLSENKTTLKRNLILYLNN